MNNLSEIIEHLGATKVAKICNVSVRAVYKWKAANVLPRTEYTGETTYSQNLAEALNSQLSSEQILEMSKPSKSSAK